MSEEKTVYVPMVADILHHGHINILKIAASYGKVIVGLQADEVAASYKRVPYMPFESRKIVVESIRYVAEVVKQEEMDYERILRKLRPDYMVHGDDWQKGVLTGIRDTAIRVMQEWGGIVIEPKYTEGVSSTLIQSRIKTRDKI